METCPAYVGTPAWKKEYKQICSKKKWCKHIRLQPKDGWDLSKGTHWWTEYTTYVPNNWKMCPICGVKRP